MKRQKSEFKPSKEKLHTELKARVTRSSRTSKPNNASKDRELLYDVDERRRKTRSQDLLEKQAKGAETEAEYCDVSIETLHSICAPAAAHQAEKYQQKRPPRSKSTSQHTELRSAPQGLSSCAEHYLFNTLEAHSLEESKLQVEGSINRLKQVAGTDDSPQSSTFRADNLSLKTWLEFSVESEDGIDLFIDLDSDGTMDWLLEKNPNMVVPPDTADDSQKQYGTYSHANDHFAISDVACYGSSNTEVPSDNTACYDSSNTGVHSDNIATFCNAVDGNMCSKTAQVELLDGHVDSCKLAEVLDSQESSTSEIEEARTDGFSLASLGRMPSFFAAGLKPSAQEIKVICNINWMVLLH